uniref:Uncharacterized protein n=1 Tax=Cannabis sativa TaxID=3483 RepID=A0A803RBH8_CANSA
MDCIKSILSIIWDNLACFPARPRSLNPVPTNIFRFNATGLKPLGTPTTCSYPVVSNARTLGAVSFWLGNLRAKSTISSLLGNSLFRPNMICLNETCVRAPSTARSSFP